MPLALLDVIGFIICYWPLFDAIGFIRCHWLY